MKDELGQGDAPRLPRVVVREGRRGHRRSPGDEEAGSREGGRGSGRGREEEAGRGALARRSSPCSRPAASRSATRRGRRSTTAEDPRSWATGWSTRPRPAPRRSCSPRSRPPGRTDRSRRRPGPPAGPGRPRGVRPRSRHERVAEAPGLRVAGRAVPGRGLRRRAVPEVGGSARAALRGAGLRHWRGSLFAWVPMFTLRRHGRAPAGKSYMHATVVVERGPFALVRHPQYLGYMLFAATAALISRHWAVVGARRRGGGRFLPCTPWRRSGTACAGSARPTRATWSACRGSTSSWARCAPCAGMRGRPDRARLSRAQPSDRASRAQQRDRPPTPTTIMIPAWIQVLSGISPWSSHEVEDRRRADHQQPVDREHHPPRAGPGRRPCPLRTACCRRTGRTP